MVALRGGGVYGQDRWGGGVVWGKQVLGGFALGLIGGGEGWGIFEILKKGKRVFPIRENQILDFSWGKGHTPKPLPLMLCWGKAPFS